MACQAAQSSAQKSRRASYSTSVCLTFFTILHIDWSQWKKWSLCKTAWNHVCEDMRRPLNGQRMSIIGVPMTGLANCMLGSLLIQNSAGDSSPCANTYFSTLS